MAMTIRILTLAVLEGENITYISGDLGSKRAIEARAAVSSLVELRLFLTSLHHSSSDVNLRPAELDLVRSEGDICWRPEASPSKVAVSEFPIDDRSRTLCDSSSSA